MTTGEGGIFVTSDSALFERVLTHSDHGRARGQTRQFWADTIGFKYKMSNLQAAAGVGQMERIDELLARRREIFPRYREGLAGRNEIVLSSEPEVTRNGFWMPTALFDRETGVTREKLQAAFAAENIDARVFFWPLSGLPGFQSVSGNVHAYDLPGRAINLPGYHDMTDDDIDRVIDVLLNVTVPKQSSRRALPKRSGEFHQHVVPPIVSYRWHNAGRHAFSDLKADALFRRITMDQAQDNYKVSRSCPSPRHAGATTVAAAAAARDGGGR